MSNNVWNVTGSGADIWGASDQFHYVWQPLAGSGSVSARVTALGDTHIAAKAGVMIRQDTTASSAYYMIDYMPFGIEVNFRTAAGVGSSTFNIPNSTALPAWLRVTRAGNTFAAYTSTDGATWVFVPNSSATIAMPASALGGLAVTSHNTGATTTGTFDGVSVGAPTWDPTRTTAPAPVAHAAVAVGLDGQVYLFGGETTSNTHQTTGVAIYDPRADVWRAGHALPVALEGAQAVTLPSGKVLVLGGEAGCNGATPCSGGTVYNTAYVYDPSTDSFSQAASMGSPRFRFAAVLWQGQVYAIGGSNGQQALSSVEAYNPSSNSWSYVASLPQAEEGAAAVVDGGGAIDVLGGFNGASTYNQLVIGRPSGGALQWSVGVAMPLADQDMGAALGPDGRVYAVGGYTGANGFLSTVQAYNPAAGTWALASAFPAGLAGIAVVALPDGRVLGIDGEGGAGPLSLTAAYGPGVQLTPDGGQPGATTTLTGQGFTPGGGVAVSWGGPGGLAGGQATADADGLIALTLTAPMTVAQGDNAVTALDGAAGYPVATGFAGSALSWNTTLTSLPSTRVRPAVALGQDGRVYAFGGTDATTSTLIYNPTTDAWAYGATVPISVEGAQAQPLPDGRLAVFGGGHGCSSQTCTIYNNANAYDPRTDTWASLPHMLSQRYRFASVALNGQIYAIGGWGEDQGGTTLTTLSSVEVYSPTANSWSYVAPLPQPQGVESMGAVAGPDGRIYVVGGMQGTPSAQNGPLYHSLYIYTPWTNSWAAGPALPTAREDLVVTQFAAALGPDGRIYAIGGYSGGTHGLGVVEVFDSHTLSWRRATSLPYTTDAMGVVSLPNRQILVIGGYSGSPIPGQTLVSIGTLTEAQGGSIPWHPHQSVRMSDGLNATVDLADGHVDVAASDLSIPARGPDLSLPHTWDSVRALNGDATTAGQGWDTDLSPSMGGALTQTVSYTDSSGTRWLFPYYGATNGGGPFSQYDIPPGQPWALSTSPITGYTLSNILTGETLTFDAQGRLQATTDAYGNSNTLTAGTNQPTSETNSGGRSLAFTYTGNGQLADAQSPLWQSGGANAAGSQHVAYGYNPQGQLTTLTRGAGTTDALTATFGYNGAELVTVTTPYTQSQHSWQLGYDPQGRVTSVTSPGQGQQGQAGYTPSYTTQFTYGVSQTVVVEGVGTSGALTHTYTLDAQGNAPQLTDVAGQGHVRTATFDVDHDVISGTDALGNTTLYTHTYVGPTGNVGLLTEEDQPPVRDGGAPGFTFAAPPTPVTPVTRYYYDPVTYDRIRVDQSTGGRKLYTYDGHHGVITTDVLTDIPGCPTACYYAWRPTVIQRDQYGEVTGMIDGRGLTVTQDQTPTVTLAANAAQYTRHTAYTTQGDVSSESTPPITTTLNGVTRTSAPVTTTYSYDGDSHPINMTSANGNTTTYGYDHLGRRVQRTLPTITLWDGSITAPTSRTGYDGDGNVALTQDADGARSTSGYDPLGRLVIQTNPVGGTTLITYTATRKASDQDPRGSVTAYRYNSVGEVIQATNPVSGAAQYQYNGDGNIIAITNGQALAGDGISVTSVITQDHDALQRVTSEAIGGPNTVTQTTQTAYTLDGSIARMLHPQGNVTIQRYDKAGERVETDLAPSDNASPNTYASYIYDAEGLLQETIDADGRDDLTMYDGDNRVVQELDSLYQEGGTTTITSTTGYDPDGNTVTRTTQTQDPTGGTHTSAETDTYNAADWLTSVTRDGETTRYGYDAAGQERLETALNGQTPVTTALDPEGRATAIGESLGGTPYTSTFAYNPNDLPVTITLPGAVQEVGGYDPASRLISVTLAGPAEGTAAQTLASSYAYGYDAVGRTVGVTTTVNTNGNTAGVQTFSYDALNRLQQAQSSDGTSQSWSYDGNGNLTQSTNNGTTTRYSYGSVANELATVAMAGQITYYGYDSRGDTTSITNTGGMNTRLSYDRQARLAGVTLADGTVITMTYNTAGERDSYTLAHPGQPTLTEQFRYRNGLLGQMTVVTGTTSYTDTYVYQQNGEPLELLRQQGGTTSRYWYEEDGRGNVVALTDATGAVVDRYAYDVWGQPLASQTSESVPQPWRYAGYWWDKELGWYWVSVRSYDPVLKRWLQPDPSQVDGVRTYVYVGDDPVDMTDPTGLCKIQVRFKKVVSLGSVPFLGDITFYHAYIITQDQGGTFYFRGGPECGVGGGSSSGSSNRGNRNIGSSNSGNCNIGSSNSGANDVGSSNSGAHHRGVAQSGGGFFGYIEAQGGPYQPGTPDYTTSPEPTMTIIDDGTPCSYYNDKFSGLVQRLNRAHIDYNPLTTNSNATVHQLLIRAGLGPYTDNNTPVGAPGWNEPLNF